MNRPTLEVCVDTLEGALTAAENGADRIELCAALSEGGLTPSYGFMRAASTLRVPVFAMIRPRRGKFVFSEQEKALMADDIRAAEDLGLAGLVLGATTVSGELDTSYLRDILAQTRLKATLHRAFDTLRDPMRGLTTAIDLGFERILTSGQAQYADGGLPLIADLVRTAGDRMSIMAGSGITPANVACILRATDVSEIHASCSLRERDTLTPDAATRLGFVVAAGEKRTCGETVQALKAALTMPLEITS